MDALRCNVEQGVAVRVVGDERHDGVILLDHWGVRQLFKVIRPGDGCWYEGECEDNQPDSVVGVRSQDVPPVRSVSQALHPHPLPAGILWMLSGKIWRLPVKNCAMSVTLIQLAPVASLCGWWPYEMDQQFNNTTTLSTKKVTFFFTYHSQPSAIRSPWGTSKRVLPTVGHLHKDQVGTMQFHNNVDCSIGCFMKKKNHFLQKI